MVYTLSVQMYYKCVTRNIIKRVNMSKKRLMIYGEKTILLKSRRVPESKKEELENIINDFLLKCVKPGYVGLEKVEVKKKVEKAPKKIEPQVVEDKEESELDLLYAEYEKLEGTFEVLEKMPMLCIKTGDVVNGHDIWTDNTFFYVKEKGSDKFNKWTKFDRIEFAKFYIQFELIRKN